MTKGYVVQTLKQPMTMFGLIEKIWSIYQCEVYRISPPKNVENCVPSKCEVLHKLYVKVHCQFVHKVGGVFNLIVEVYLVAKPS